MKIEYSFSQLSGGEQCHVITIYLKHYLGYTDPHIVNKSTSLCDSLREKNLRTYQISFNSIDSDNLITISISERNLSNYKKLIREKRLSKLTNKLNHFYF